MRNFLMGIEVFISILLIVVVVAQSSKSTGMGAVSGGAGDSMFGGKARGIDGLLYKLTIFLAIIFGAFSLWLDVLLNTY